MPPGGNAYATERSYDRGFGSVGFYRSAVEELGEVLEPTPAVARLPGVPAQCLVSYAHPYILSFREVN